MAALVPRIVEQLAGPFAVVVRAGDVFSGECSSEVLAGSVVSCCATHWALGVVFIVETD